MRKLVSWKKLILLALCVCMVFTLVACANTGNNSNGGAETPVYTDYGAVAKNPADSIGKIVSAIFADNDKEKYLNAGFSGDFKLNLGKNNIVNLYLDVRASIDRKDSSASRFSIVLNSKGDVNTNPKVLWGAYFDGKTLKVDNRGIGGKFTIVDTDIIYLINLLANEFNGSATATADGIDIETTITEGVKQLVKGMVASGVIQVYEKYIEENNSTQVTVSLYVRDLIKYIQKTLLNVKDGALGGLIAGFSEETINSIVQTLDKVYNAVPINSSLNIGVGVRGSYGSYELVNGSFKFDSNIIKMEFNGSDLDFGDQAGNIATPVNEPTDYNDIEKAKLGGFGMDISLGVEMTEGDISIADIDHALGGILDKLANDLYANDPNRSKIDFSKNYIHVQNNVAVDVRLGASFQLDVKDNSKTNLLLEIYFDQAHDGILPNQKCDAGEALLQIYYVGKDQAFYIDLTGLGKTNTLPNKLKIDKDLDGNPINLTNLFTDKFLKLIIVNGKLDFRPLIEMVQNLMKPEGAPAQATSAEVDALNDKLLENSLPLVLDQQGNAQPDVMKIVQIILRELNFDKNSADILSGISVNITSQMFKDIFKEALVGQNLGDIFLIDSASVGLHIDNGLRLDIEATLDANDYDSSDVVKGFPVVKFGIHANIKPFAAFDENRLPQDRYDGNWQNLEIVKKTNQNGGIDLLGTIFASLQNKKVYLSASANLQVHVDGTKDSVSNIGAALNNSIGGALGAALADLQLRTGQIDADYTLSLVANINLASFVGLDFNTTPIMQILERIIGDQEIMITLESIKNRNTAEESKEEILAILLSGGKLYVDAEAIGIPKAVIDTQTIFDMFPQSAAQSYASTQAAPQDPNATKKLIIALLSNVDILTIMQDEIAIGLNSAFLNVLLPILMPNTNIDATLNQLGASIKFKSDTFTPDEANKSLLNQLEVKVGFATDFAGLNVKAAVALGGLNIGIVDTSTEAKYKVESVYFQNRDISKFNNPFGNTLLTLGLKGTLKLTGDGEFTLSNANGDNKLNGEIGAMLNTLALVLGMDNVNKELTITLDAALDLTNKIDNNSQIALQITTLNAQTNQNDVLVGIYVYNKAVYVNIPLLMDPFKVDFDVANFVFGIINGDINLGGKDAAPVDAITTANDGTGTELQALTSLINLTNKAAEIRISSDMLKGIIVTLLGNMTKAPAGTQPKLNARVGDELIEMVHTLPFDLLVLSTINYGGKEDKLLKNLAVDLNVYLGKNVLQDYKDGKDLKLPQQGVIGLGLNLSNVYVEFNESTSVIKVIKDALTNNEFDYMGKIDSITNADIGKILKETKLSVELNLSLAVSSKRGIIGATDEQGKPITIPNDIVIGLNEVIGTLPNLFIRLGALDEPEIDALGQPLKDDSGNIIYKRKELVNLHIHLAASVDVGKLLAGDYNSAISLSLGIYRDNFVDYETSKNNKILSVVAMPETNNGRTTLTAYIDAVGFGTTEGGRLLNGKIKLDNLDLNQIISNMNNKASAQAGEPADYPSTMAKVDSIVSILNNALSMISITNDSLSADLGSNILALVLGILTKQDGSANTEVLPLTSGNITIYTKEHKDGKETILPGIYAKVGLREKGAVEPNIELGIGISNLHLSFSKKGGTFLHEEDFDATTFVAIRDLQQISLNANLGLDVDLNEGKHTLNLMNYYNSFFGQVQVAMASTKEGIDFINGAGMNGLHLGVKIHGTIGITDVTKTFVHVRISAYTSKDNRLADKDAKLFLDVYLYRDNLYISSDILNINKIKVPKVGFSQFISNKIKPILSGVGSAQSGDAIATANEPLSFLIGDRKMEIEVSKAFVTELLTKLVTSVPAETLKTVIDDLFGSLKIEANLKTMSASVNVTAIKNQQEKPSASHLVDFTLALNGLEVSAFEDKNTHIINESEYEEAIDNAFAELGASVTLERKEVKVNDDKTSPNYGKPIIPLDNIFGKLSGVINSIDSIDKPLRETLNQVIQNLYVDIMSKEGNPDNGFAVTLNVLLQVNVNWKSWQALDLHDSSFRLKISDTKNNTILDAYLIGNTGLTGALYVSAPMLGTVDGTGNGEALTNIKITGINLIEMIEAATQKAPASSVCATGTANNTIETVLDIANKAIGEIKFTGKGVQLGLGPKALTAVASALGLVPSLDAGLTEALGSIIAEFPDTEAGSGIYVDYPVNVDNKTTPVIGLRYGLVGVGGIDIKLNHYAAGVVNKLADFDKATLPFKDKEGLKQLVNFTLDDGGIYKDIAKLQNVQVRVKGSLSAGFKSENTDLSELVKNVLGSILGIAPLRELGMMLESDLNNQNNPQTLHFEVAANIDLSSVLNKLQLDLTIFNKTDKNYDYNNTLVRVFYADNTLYVKAPNYLNDIMRIEHVNSLFGGNGASAQAPTDTPTETTTTQRLAALQIVFGGNSVGINVVGGIFDILLTMLQGQGLTLDETMFDALKENFGIGIELGSIKPDGDGHIYLPDLYASVNINMGPLGLGLRLEQPEVVVANEESLMPIEEEQGVKKSWKEKSVHYKDLTFRIKASGRFGIEAENTELKLNELLKDFGVNKGLNFNASLKDPNDPNHKPLNLHLGLELDAELCLGDFNKCNIKLAINAYRNAQKFTDAPLSEADKIGELLAVYITRSTVYLDLDNEIISIGTIYLNKLAMNGIMDAIKKPMTETPADQNAPAVSDALATAPVVENNEFATQTQALSNLIKLSFTNAGEGAIQELGSISAEIGAGVINKIFAMLGLDFLAQGNIAGAVKIDVPNSKNGFGIGLNIKTEGGKLVNGLGLYVWLGDLEFVNKNEIDINRPVPSVEIATSAMDLSQLYNKFVHVGLEASLAMMRSSVINNKPDAVQPNENGNGIIMNKLLTEFFSNVVPWMPDFLAQLEVLGSANKDDFFASHSIRLQANVNVGMLINHKTCTVCGKDFTGKEDAFVNHHVCPNPTCNAPLDKIVNREFYLNDMDVAIEIIRNNKNVIDSDSAGSVTTTPTVLLGLYVENSEIKLYGEPFGLNNFIIEKSSVESIAKTITSLFGGSASVSEGSALSTFGSVAYATAGTTPESQPEKAATPEAQAQGLDIVGLLNNLVKAITISMYSIRVGITDNILSYIPQLTKMLGIQGFPEYGYPTLTEENYIEIGLIRDEKVQPALTINLDMFGVNTAVSVKGIDLGVGSKEQFPIIIDQKIQDAFKDPNMGKLDNENSIINLNVEAELGLNLNKANGNLSDLIGGLLGNLEAGYKVDNTISKDFLLRIRGQVDIVNYSIVLGIEILEQFDNDNDGKIDLVTPGSPDDVKTVLGVYYDSTKGTAYLESSILSNLKVTGIELSDLIGRLTSEDALAVAAVAGIRPILNRDIFNENTDNPAVKVTIALQQYLAVAISSELINQIINGIDVINKVPVLPDYEIGVKIGRELKDGVSLKPGGNPSSDYNPFGITLQVGLGKNNGGVEGEGFLIDLAAKIYLGPINNTTADGNTTVAVGGTYINIINKDQAKNEYRIITEEMDKFPEVLHVAFDTEGYLKPEIIAEEVKLSLSIDLAFGMNKGTNNFGYIFEKIFGETAEVTAVAKAYEKKELNLRVGLDAQINIKNLVVPIIGKGEPSLKGTNIKLSVKDLSKLEGENDLFELTLVGGGKTETDGSVKDVIYIKIKDFDEDAAGKKSDLNIKIDTINIMELISSLQPQSTSALSTASSSTALAEFINTIIKDIHITGDNTSEYVRVNVNFMPNVLDNIIKLLPILLADMNNATVAKVLEMVQQINLPIITDGGLYLRFKQNNKAVGDKAGVGLGVGIDLTFDGMTRMAFGVDIAGVQVLDKNSAELADQTKFVKPSGLETDYTSVKDLKLNLDFEGYVEVSNHNTPDPISIGGLITTILGLLNKNLGGEVDFNINTINTERYGLKLEGFVDMQDFQLSDKKDSEGNLITRPNKTSKLKLSLSKDGRLSTDAKGKAYTAKDLIAIYLDFNTNSIYADLTGMNLPKLKLTGLDLAQMLGNVISPYVGGNKQVNPATATAGAGSLQTNKLSALLYLGIDKEMTQLRFNADLINGLLQLVLGLVLQMTDSASPNYAIISGLQGLELPEFGMIEITSSDKANTSAFDIRIYRTANVKDDNYLAIGVQNARMSTKLNSGDSIFTVGKTGSETVNIDTYPTIFDMKKHALQLEQIAIDAELNLNLDFTNRGSKDYSFTRYISRLLAILIDGKDTPENVAKYEVMIVGSGNMNGNDSTRVLQYKLTIKGVLDITDIFGKSNLAIELWKMDMVNGANKGIVTDPTNFNGTRQTKNHVMLLGAYLKKDDTNGLPSLYLDLNNLGLPRVKLVGIDSLLGSAVSESSAYEVLGTGNYDIAEQTAQKIYNNITVKDNNLSIELNRGFLYGVLEMLMPQMFQDGLIVVGGMKLPLPKIAGVKVGIDFSNGISGLDLMAGLEEDTENYLGISLKLNEIRLGDNEKVKVPIFNWDNIGDKMNVKNGNQRICGEEYFGTFGSVHIGTSFASDMLSSIIDSLNPNVLIDYQKRGNSMSYYGSWHHHTTAYDRVLKKETQDFPGDGSTNENNNDWAIARIGQSWNQIYLSRAKGSAAQNLVLNIHAQAGSLGIHNNVSVTVSPDAKIHANLVGAISLTQGLSGIGALKNIAIPLNAPSIGDMVLPGQSAITTAEFDPLGSVFANLKINELIKGISVRIYTAAQTGKGTAPKTIVQVKVDPKTIDNLFQGVNLLLSNIFDPSVATDPTKTPEWIGSHPEFMAKALVKFIRANVNDTLGAALGPDSVMRGPRREFTGFIGSLLPLPKLNTSENSIPDSLAMNTTNDQDGNATEKVRAELNITLDYNVEKVKIVGALESIRAEFGNDYGFNKAPCGAAANSADAMNQPYYKNGNPQKAVEAVRHGLGYVLLNIGADSKDKLLGFKSVKEVKSYNNGGDNALRNMASGYYDTSTKKWVDNGEGKAIVINDPLTSVDELKVAINAQLASGKLPTKAHVLYTDGTSTGGAVKDQPDTALPISIVWDDSRININPNGSNPDGNDNYLYGWVQNILIAKIPVIVKPEAHQLNSLKGFDMPTGEERKAVNIEMLDSNQRIDILTSGANAGYANLKITLDSYITKNLPTAITFRQGRANKEQTYTTTAVKRIVYRSIEPDVVKDYNTETEENLSMVWDDELQRNVKVEMVGWKGDWYYSANIKTEVAGKLEWDTSNLVWSTSNPYDVNKDIGGPIKTVAMKLITGKFDTFVLDKIQVEVKNFITKEQVIAAINKLYGKNGDKQLDVNIMANPDFMNILKDISYRIQDTNATSYWGTGLSINVNGKKLNISPSEIHFDFTALDRWLNDRTENKYKGKIIKVPVSIKRDIPNASKIGGKEAIEFNFDLVINIESIELLNAKFVDKITRISSTGYETVSYRDINISLNPYMSFEQQFDEMISKKQSEDKEPCVMLFVRLANGDVKQIVLPIAGTKEAPQDALNILSDSRVKLDIASLYGAYGSSGSDLDIRIMVGSASHGYIEGFVPVSISKANINPRDLNIDILGYNADKAVNVLRADSLTNVTDEDINAGLVDQKDLKVKIPVRIGSTRDNGFFDIVWFDEKALLDASSTGATNIEIDAVIGYMQQGNPKRNIVGESKQNLNNYLNKRVKLKISKVDMIYGMRLVSFAGSDLTVNRTTGDYILASDIQTNTGELKFRYYNDEGKIVNESKQVTLNFDIHSKKTSISIGLYNFNIAVNDNITMITEFTVGGENRVFSIDENGNFVIKYSFVEKLPVEETDKTKINVTARFVVPVFENGKIKVDADGNPVVNKEQYLIIELTQSATNPKLYEGVFVGPYAGGPYTFKVIVTK